MRRAEAMAGNGDLVSRRLGPHIHGHDTDVLMPFRSYTDGGSVTQARFPQNSVRKFVAAATMLAVALAGLGWWVHSQGSGSGRVPQVQPDGNLSHTGAAADPALTPPRGMKYVGYGNLMIAVPRGWRQTSWCSTHAAGAVMYPQGVTEPDCAEPLALATASFRQSIVGPPELLGRSVPAGEIDGQRLLITPVQRHGSVYRQLLAVPTEQFYLAIKAPHRGLVQQITASAQSLPMGYAVVPSLRSMRIAEVPAALEAARLSPQLEVVHRPDGPQVVGTQTPAVGTVVPEWSRVSFRSR